MLNTNWRSAKKWGAHATWNVSKLGVYHVHIFYCIHDNLISVIFITYRKSYNSRAVFSQNCIQILLLIMVIYILMCSISKQFNNYW